MAGSALANAGMLAMGIGGGEGFKGVVVENAGEDSENSLPRSPSPPTIQINVQEEDGNLRRISSIADPDDFEVLDLLVEQKSFVAWLLNSLVDLI